MPKERERRTIFLSHAQSDAEAAKLLKKWLLSAFGSDVQVFVSSDWQSIEMGMNWYDTIDHALHDSMLGIVLLTENSIKRPWVTYELGALRAARKKTIPVCIGRVTKAALPSPFSHAQACDYDRREDRLDLLRSIASTFAFPTSWVPEAAVDSAPIIVVGPLIQLSPLTSSHGSGIQRLFSRIDRWTTVVYTCRSTFTGEQCVPDGPIKRALWSHIPVDEVHTVCTAINHLMPSELRASEDDILHTVMCSRRAEIFLKSALEGVRTSESVPQLFDRDLVIVGENNFSNMLLQMMQAYLPWQVGTGQIERRRGQPRPDVYVELVPRLHASISAVQKRELHKGGAMIARFPNPFNIRKEVLVLFGCHRDGQYTLEEWLRSEEVPEMVARVSRGLKEGTQAIQILVDRTLGSADRSVQPKAPEAITNLADGNPFWLTPLNIFDPDKPLIVNDSCSQPYGLYDLSLVLQLPLQEQARVAQTLMSSLGIENLYWEHSNCEIGFHVTLYEFLTHRRPEPQLIRRLEAITPGLCGAVCQTQERAPVKGVIARIRSLEIFPSALVAYAEFLDEPGRYSTWLDSVRQWCEEVVVRASLAEHRDLLNSMRVPFPAHVTICRFNRELSETEQSRLSQLAKETRGLELLTFSVDSLLLTVATQTPYRGVRPVLTIPLEARSLAEGGEV
jgi:TIR domain